MDAEVEDEVFVDGVVHASGEVGLVVILAGDAEVFEVAACFFGEFKTEDGGVKEFEFVVAAVFVEEVVEFGHEAEADGVGEAGAPGNDEAAFPFVVAGFGSGGDFHEGHEGEGGVTVIVTVEVPLETHRDIAKALAAVVAVGIEIDHGLKVGVQGESGFEIELAVGEGFTATVAAVVEEGGFKGEATGIDGEGGFGRVGTVGGEWTEEVVGSGVEEVVGRFSGGVEDAKFVHELRICGDGGNGYPANGADEVGIGAVWIVENVVNRATLAGASC